MVLGIGIGFRVTGYNETLGSLNSMSTGIVREAIGPELDSWGNDILSGFKRRGHRISGRMVGSMRLTNTGPISREVSVNTEYAEIENSRPGEKPGHGPHNFVDPTLQENNARHFDRMTWRMETYIRSH